MQQSLYKSLKGDGNYPFNKFESAFLIYMYLLVTKTYTGVYTAY